MIYPSIDLMNGKAVQLVQGRQENKKLELDHVFELAQTFSALGSINVIDLDAAMGLGTNEELIGRLAAVFSIRVGGGIRSISKARNYIEAGAQKIIIGSAAFASDGINVPFLEELNKAVDKSRIIVALDSYEKVIVTGGWKEKTSLDAVNVIRSLEKYCGEFLYTQVDKEGMMEGTDCERILALRALTSNAIAAAGGISSIEEIKFLGAHGISSVLGMALYTGKLSFEALLELKSC